MAIEAVPNDLNDAVRADRPLVEEDVPLDKQNNEAEDLNPNPFADACLMQEEGDPFANVEPPRFLLQHTHDKSQMFPVGYVSVLAGSGGVGKSKTVLQMLCEMAIGKPCLADGDGNNGYDSSEHTRPMFYWAAEDPLSIVKWRMNELLDEMDADQAARECVAERVIRFSTLDHDNAKLCSYDQQAKEPIPNAEVVVGLRRLIDEYRVGLLVIDPFTSVTPGELERDNNAAHEFMRAHLGPIARAHDMAVLVLHHTVKGAGKNVTGQDAIRGASGIVNGARSAATMLEHAEEGFVVFESVKENLSRKAKPFCLRTKPGKKLLVERAEKEAVDRGTSGSGNGRARNNKTIKAGVQRTAGAEID